MWRWLIFFFGGILMVTTAFFTNYRATHPADSVAIVVFEEDYTDSATKLIRIDMMRNQQTLFELSFYDEKEIQHYAWSPDGQWLLVLLRDVNRFSELHIVSYDGLTQRKIYQADAVFDYPRWAPDSQGIILAEYVDNTASGAVSIKWLDLNGHPKTEYLVDAESSFRWDFAWFDDDTLWLSDSPTRPTGYFIDTRTGHITENTEFKYPHVYNGVSPDGQWFLEVRSRGITLNNWYNTADVRWTISPETIPLTDSLQMGWSSDSQWVALLGYEAPTQQTSTTYYGYGVADIYIVSTDGTEIIQLTDDDRVKSLVLTESRNNIYMPFSPYNHWLLYLDETGYPPTINAVRTDGSGEEIANWFSSQQTYISHAKWAPAIDAPIQAMVLILGGLLLIPVSLTLTAWHIRRQI